MACVFILYSSSIFPLEKSLSVTVKNETIDEEKQMIDSIEYALDARDKIKIINLMLNEVANKYIVQKLTFYLRHVDKVDLKKLETILEAEVRPKYSDPYYNAIKNENLNVCSLLQKFNINPGKRDRKIYLSKFNVDDITLQSPPSFLQKLSEITLNEKVHQEIEQEIDKIYNELSEKLQAEKNKSIKENKPLLILIGEQHYSLNSFMYELIILHLIQSYNIDTLFTEAFSAKSYSGYHWSNAVAIEKVALQLNIHKQPVDLFACHQSFVEHSLADCANVPRVTLPSEYDWVSPEGVEDRNKVIAQEIIKSGSNKDKIVIVGSGHMMGLNRLLSSHFHVIPLSVAKLAQSHRKAESTVYAKEAVEYAKSVELPNFKFLANQRLFLSANLYVDKAKEGYKRYQASVQKSL